MVKLIINKKFVDLSPDFVYEIKQPHPISSGLSNVYTAYSSDITLPLTSTNIAVFDYSLRKDSSQVHKTLEGYLIRSNGVTNVDVIVRTFTKKGIKIYIVEKISESVKGLLDGDFMLNELPYKDYRHLSGRITEISDTDLFSFASYNTQENVFPSISLSNLVGRLNTFFGLNISLPIGMSFRVFANQAKWFDIKNFTTIQTINDLQVGETRRRMVGLRKFFTSENLRGVQSYSDTGTYALHLKKKEDVQIRLRGEINVQIGRFLPTMSVYFGTDTDNLQPLTSFNRIDNPPTPSLVFDRVAIIEKTYITEGQDYYLWLQWDEALGVNTTTTIKMHIDYQYLEEVGEETDMIAGHNFLFDCFKNLPKVTVLQFLKAIALANGYTLTFEGDNVNFKKLSDFFSVANTFDASDYFIEADQLDFVYLKYQRNFIRYGANTPPYATIEVNDNTLESEGDFLVIENILPTDDDNVQLWDYTDPDKIKIREGVATIPFQALDLETYENFAQFLDEAFVFTAKFKAFRITGAPIYVKQLNGIFLPTEIIERISGSELKEIKLKMLKL
jgi:hypothetical protein